MTLGPHCGGGSFRDGISQEGFSHWGGAVPLQGWGDTTAIVASLQSEVFSSFSLLHTLSVTGLLSGLPLTLRSMIQVNSCKQHATGISLFLCVHRKLDCCSCTPWEGCRDKSSHGGRVHEYKLLKTAGVSLKACTTICFRMTFRYFIDFGHTPNTE